MRVPPAGRSDQQKQHTVLLLGGTCWLGTSQPKRADHGRQARQGLSPCRPTRSPPIRLLARCQAPCPLLPPLTAPWPQPAARATPWPRAAAAAAAAHPVGPRAQPAPAQTATPAAPQGMRPCARRVQTDWAGTPARDGTRRLQQQRHILSLVSGPEEHHLSISSKTQASSPQAPACMRSQQPRPATLNPAPKPLDKPDPQPCARTPSSLTWTCGSARLVSWRYSPASVSSTTACAAAASSPLLPPSPAAAPAPACAGALSARPA